MTEFKKLPLISLKVGESSDYLFYYNGISYYKQKKYKEAIASFQKGLSFLGEPRNYEEQFLTLLGESYYKLKDTEMAFEYFDKVLEINPYNLYVLNNYSFYLAILNMDLERAEAMSKKCIMMDRRNYNYLDTYGWILFKKGKYLESLEILKKALDLGGKSDNNILKHYNDLFKGYEYNATQLKYKYLIIYFSIVFSDA
ncbi:MAG: tetratricopeptide repeat protein, partial [Chloroflexia bacterium]|nr:tetratricopeptide repeat protein [Chloroflexia bacterium]